MYVHYLHEAVVVLGSTSPGGKPLLFPVGLFFSRVALRGGGFSKRYSLLVCRSGVSGWCACVRRRNILIVLVAGRFSGSL